MALRLRGLCLLLSLALSLSLSPSSNRNRFAARALLIERPLISSSITPSAGRWAPADMLFSAPGPGAAGGTGVEFVVLCLPELSVREWSSCCYCNWVVVASELLSVGAGDTVLRPFGMSCSVTLDGSRNWAPSLSVDRPGCAASIR